MYKPYARGYIRGLYTAQEGLYDSAKVKVARERQMEETSKDPERIEFNNGMDDALLDYLDDKWNGRLRANIVLSGPEDFDWLYC